MVTQILIICSLVVAAPDGGISSLVLDDEVKNILANRVACGPLSVWYCLARFGKVLPADRIIRQAQLDPDGMSASRLVELCKSFGLSARAVSGPRDRLSDLPTPAILFLDDRHCVVYDGEGESRAYESVRVFEPVTRHVGDEDARKLRDLWTGEAIVFADMGPSLTELYVVSLAAAALPIVMIQVVGRMRCLITAKHRPAMPRRSASEGGAS